MAATSAKDAWAVGEFFPNEGSGWTLIEHWNGTTWTRQNSPNKGSKQRPPEDNFLNGVAATSSTNAWAVGRILNQHGDDRTLALHWNGTAWSP